MEVGGYVRHLITGKIYKILEIFYLSEELNIKYFKTGKFTGFNSYEQFEYKYSSNIKELIQEGDIIKWKTKDNSYYGINEVIKRLETGEKLGIYPEEYDFLLPIEDIEIEAILTKEKFENNCYEINQS